MPKIVGRGRPGEHRAHVQHRPPQADVVERLRQHLADRRLVGQEQPLGVGLEHGVPAFVGALVERPVAEPPPADPGDVEQDVEPAAEELQRARRTGAADGVRTRRRRPRSPGPDRAACKLLAGGVSFVRRSCPATTTRAPSSRNRRAVARPIPLVPPTIRQPAPEQPAGTLTS